MAEIKLEDKVAIVTGAGGGMGRVMALSLAEAGTLVIAVDISSKALKDLTEGAEALGLGARILPMVTDLGDREACEAVVPKTLTKTGGLHLLVNNAGVGMQASVCRPSIPIIRSGRCASGKQIPTDGST